MPDKFYRSRQTEFRSADPADGQSMAIEGYFVVFDQRNWRTRKQFATLAEAEEFITKFYAPAVGG